MPPTDLVERLVEVCGDLKEGLVEYVWQPRRGDIPRRHKARHRAPADR
jgi:hypothetical protein